MYMYNIIHVHNITSHFDTLTVTSILCTGVGYPAFSQGTGSATAGPPSTPQSVGYPAQVQHPSPFGVHSGWSVWLYNIHVASYSG